MRGHLRRVIRQYATGMLTGRIPTADQVRLPPMIAGYGIEEDFASTSPGGLSWAGSPFSTPPTIDSIGSTWMRIYGFSAGERSFLYRSTTRRIVIGSIGLDTNSDGMYSGLRMDDGTDNNYVEFVQWWATGGTYRVRFYLRQRLGGGAVTETEYTHLAMPILPQNTFLYLGRNAASWSSWPAACILFGTTVVRGGNSAANSWTPTRVGWITRFGAATWQGSYIDILTTVT